MMREKLIALSMVKKGDWNKIHSFLRQDRELNSIDDRAAHQLVNQLGCEAVTLIDSDYPVMWHEMSKPPFVVYLKGDRTLLARNVVTVVGGKRISRHTKEAVYALMKQLPVDVSLATGFELGVEAYANEHTSRRIACIAAGFKADELYRKYQAYHGLICDDLLMSEVPPQVKFDLNAYYRSYRLLAELSQVVCVFELPSFDARVKYLTYLTEVGKDVVVLPDKNHQYTAGGLGLINLGARCLMGPVDVLDLL